FGILVSDAGVVADTGEVVDRDAAEAVEGAFEFEWRLVGGLTEDGCGRQGRDGGDLDVVAWPVHSGRVLGFRCPLAEDRISGRGGGAGTESGLRRGLLRRTQ